MKMRFSASLLSLLAMASFTGSAGAAITISSWDYRTLTSADSLAPIGGATTVAAFNLGGGVASLGGVNFTAANVGGYFSSAPITQAAFSAPGAAWGNNFTGAGFSNAVLNSFGWTSQNNGTFEVAGLTSGQQYTFQFINADARTGGPDGRKFQITGATLNGAAVTGSSSQLRYAYVGADQYGLISATFTADASGKAAFVSSIFSSTDVAAGAQLNAVHIMAVPEPSTYGLMGAGALAAVTAVRRRRKAV